MIERFEGNEGRRRLVETLATNRLVCHERPLAEALADTVSLEELPAGTTLITEGGADDDMYFVLSGCLAISVRGTYKTKRLTGSHVGEMSAITPSRPRSATVVATEPTIVAKLSEADFSQLVIRFPVIWRRLAEELAERVADSNRLVPTARTQARLFVISASEALAVARAVELNLSTAPFATTVLDKGVFHASSYPIEALEAALDDCDFALAIATGEDQTISRAVTSASPRDNVTFEAGFFMGRLGRRRTFILKPRDLQLKLASDLAGLTLLNYATGAEADLSERLLAACDEIRGLIANLGVRS